MLKIYGSMLCKDCVECVEDLKKANVDFEFLDFADSLLYLKEFLAIRDGNDQFNAAREKGSIGIPAIVKEDSSVTLDWDEFLK
jgi:glutaredoxin-related protein